MFFLRKKITLRLLYNFFVDCHENLSSVVEEYIKAKPFLQSALAQGLLI